NDLALLKVSGKFKPLAIGESKESRLGESVFTIGFPNPIMQGMEPKLTRGDISSLSGMKDDRRHFQISVPVQPGNSGGPLVDMSGNVVGIVTMRLGDFRALQMTGAIPQNVNYAVKSELIRSFAEAVPEVKRALKMPHKAGAGKFDEIVTEVELGTATILGF
ncbi:MAG TPA: serine protease, partial [Verrucomicrobiae bacterium]